MNSIVQAVVIGLPASLAGAFAGAYAAFLLESVRRRNEKRAENIAAANAALFTLGAYYNELLQYKRDVVLPMEAQNNDFLQPTDPWPKNRPELNFSSLMFLVSDGSPDVLSALYLEQQRVNLLLNSNEQYSQAHVYELQPKMANYNVPDGEPLSEQDATKIAGIDLYSRLRGLNDYIKTDIATTIRSIDDVMISIRGAVGKTYKNAELLEFRVDVEKLKSATNIES